MKENKQIKITNTTGDGGISRVPILIHITYKGDGTDDDFANW